jgi:hypothetical protein
MAKMGRPKKAIKQEQFEAMCQIQATQEEITLVLGVSDKTLNAWCKRTYGKTFSDVFREKRSAGKISLRRKQWKLADRSAAMAIFLGKQFLGQTDRSEMEVNTTVQNNPLAELTTDDLKKLIDKEG